MKWISIENFLPEDYERVLVQIENFPDATIGYYDADKRVWNFTEDPFKDNVDDIELKVKYWMQLPRVIEGE